MVFFDCGESAATSERSSSKTDLFELIAVGNEAAIETLYGAIGRAIRVKVRREFPDDHEDIHHTVFLDVLRAIQDGSIRDPAALFGFVRTIVRRRRSDLIGARILDREVRIDVPDCASQEMHPDDLLIEQQRMQVALLALSRLSPRDRRIVTDFYFDGLTREQVIKENQLTETQYRVFKSRALKRMKQYSARYIQDSSIDKNSNTV
jgi:RNA polymerase sigma factor (sigma-70 family)